MSTDRHEAVVHRLRWLLLLAGLLAAVLAWIGAAAYLDQLDAGWDVWDRAYLVMQAFGAQLPAVPEGSSYPPSLQVARFLAPLTLASALAVAALSLFSDAWDAARIRWAGRTRPIAMVCGLGAIGSQVAEALLADGRALGGRRPPTVVAIERPGAPGTAAARRRGVLVVEGDARDPLTWARAGAARASVVVVACGDDQATGEAAMAARSVVSGHGATPVPILAHLRDRELVVRQHQDLVHDDDAVGPAPVSGPARITTFNLAETTAARLLAVHPPFGLDPAGPARVVVAGTDDLARSLVVHAARLWSLTSRHRDDGERLAVLLAGRRSSATAAELLGRVPDLDQVVTLDVDEGDLHAADAPARLLDGDGDGDGQRLYVCLEDEAAGLALAVRVVDEAPTARVVLQAGRSAGTAALVLADDPRIVTFAPLEVATDVLTLFGTRQEQLARLAHETYLGQVAAGGDLDPAGRASHRPWSELGAAFQADNVALVAAQEERWAALGFGRTTVSLTGARVPVPITGEELEALARAEHERWQARKEADGWTLGELDEVNRCHPDLVPWEQLDDAAKSKDRVAVLSWPRGLAGLGQALSPRS